MPITIYKRRNFFFYQFFLNWLKCSYLSFLFLFFIVSQLSFSFSSESLIFMFWINFRILNIFFYQNYFHLQNNYRAFFRLYYHTTLSDFFFRAFFFSVKKKISILFWLYFYDCIRISPLNFVGIVLSPKLKERNIGLISASPLSLSLLTDRGPPSWHPARPEDKNACREAALYCQRHGHDISKLALQYSLSHAGQLPMTLVGMGRWEDFLFVAMIAIEIIKFVMLFPL